MFHINPAVSKSCSKLSDFVGNISHNLVPSDLIASINNCS